MAVGRLRFIKDQSGAALLEFALFASMLLILFFGIIDIGRALFTANNLTAAAREGARYASAGVPVVPTVSDIKNRVATYMSPFGSAPIDTATQISVTFQPALGPGLQSITVTINYPFSWITPIRALVGGTFTDTLHARARFRWEGS
ncbi:MAG TPA: TadE/TadG family type IV pilus assembly protein [Gemmatimonadaceae bacterium]|nr:TadE/TadG family type IV pilus assembly protein [Gemmatimonadaceae bacterium]